MLTFFKDEDQTLQNVVWSPLWSDYSDAILLKFNLQKAPSTYKVLFGLLFSITLCSFTLLNLSTFYAFCLDCPSKPPHPHLVPQFSPMRLLIIKSSMLASPLVNNTESTAFTSTLPKSKKSLLYVHFRISHIIYPFSTAGIMSDYKYFLMSVFTYKTQIILRK